MNICKKSDALAAELRSPTSRDCSHSNIYFANVHRSNEILILLWCIISRWYQILNITWVSPSSFYMSNLWFMSKIYQLFGVSCWDNSHLISILHFPTKDVNVSLIEQCLQARTVPILNEFWWSAIFVALTISFYNWAWQPAKLCCWCAGGDFSAVHRVLQFAIRGIFYWGRYSQKKYRSTSWQTHVFSDMVQV